jgi:hypothetical protein
VGRLPRRNEIGRLDAAAGAVAEDEGAARLADDADMGTCRTARGPDFDGSHRVDLAKVFDSRPRRASLWNADG